MYEIGWKFSKTENGSRLRIDLFVRRELFWKNGSQTGAITVRTPKIVRRSKPYSVVVFDSSPVRFDKGQINRSYISKRIQNIGFLIFYIFSSIEV